MKKAIALTFVALVSLFALSAFSLTDDKPISFAQLPKAAQQFVKTHFPSQQVSLVTLDNDLIGKSYEVLLADGTRIEFNKRGIWKDVELKQGTVPTKIVPSKIMNYVKTNFPGTTIKQIEKRDRGGYQVDLSNDIELKFDAQLNFIRVDD